jgi:three-Cys-motif partner protein
MTRRKRDAREGQAHRFGGDWTSKKLDILRRYLISYSTALQKQPFKTAYIDAFAGTGYRASKQADQEGYLPFPDLAEENPQALLEGSARMALGVTPRFDRYVFIEKDPDRCAELKRLQEEFPDLAGDIQVKPGEANATIQKLCRKNWENHRAVLFLDPYGMQVEWRTIEAVAGTGAIDLWLLVPLGIGLNRLLPQHGQIPAGWRHRLDSFLGTDDWYKAFYEEETTPRLFGEQQVSKVGIEKIGRYFIDRLKQVFPGVAPNPSVLTNSANSPLYLFCFAVGNPNERARSIALRIARHILENE